LITKITGKLLAVADDAATLEVDSFEYEVLIPEFNRRQLQSRIGEAVSLYTIHYLEGNPAHGRLTPRFVGFLRELEREFFEMICSVDGVGVKKALRAMVRPVQEVAEMIEEQDAKSLSTLPGVGAATAERIIAKLRRKMPKFALIVSREHVAESDVRRDVVDDTFHALVTLGHSETDARKLIDSVLQTKKKFSDVESMLRTIYDASHGRT
jgi:Holliday junction DNA helicase RuvA